MVKHENIVAVAIVCPSCKVVKDVITKSVSEVELDEIFGNDDLSYEGMKSDGEDPFDLFVKEVLCEKCAEDFLKLAFQ